MEKFFTSEWKNDTMYSTKGRDITLDDLERGKNLLLYGLSVTNKELLKDQLKDTPVGKIIYG